MPERGARIARREERAYWAYVSDEQRREAGCPARQAVLLQRRQATSLVQCDRVRRSLSGVLLVFSAVVVLLHRDAVARIDPASKLPPSVARYLARVGFDTDDVAAVAAGRAASRVIEASTRELLGVVAVVRVDRPAHRYIDAFRDIVTFEKGGNGVISMGTFSKPAKLDDIGALTLTDVDLDDLRHCRVTSCDMNLSAAAIQRFRQVKWSAPAAQAQARHVWQTTLVDYVNDYQARGNAALVAYEDRSAPIALAARSTALFAESDALAPLSDVASYFTKYRSLPLPPEAEEFFYWQQLTFGMKPVTRVNHVVMSLQTIDGRPSWAIVSRMIYSSHYFRDGLEVRYLVPVDASTPAGGFYLVLVSRSHSESLAGLKGLLLGGIIRRKVRDSTARHVAHVKAKLEERP